MIDTSYSLMLRNLSSDYYHGHIGFAEYRAQRKIILDKVDAELNCEYPEESAQQENEPASTLMQTISFFKNTDAEN